MRPGCAMTTTTFQRSLKVGENVDGTTTCACGPLRTNAGMTPHFLQRLRQLLENDRRQSQCRPIQDQYLWPHHQCAAEGEHLFARPESVCASWPGARSVSCVVSSLNVEQLCSRTAEDV